MVRPIAGVGILAVGARAALSPFRPSLPFNVRRMAPVGLHAVEIRIACELPSAAAHLWCCFPSSRRACGGEASAETVRSEYGPRLDKSAGLVMQWSRTGHLFART